MGTNGCSQPASKYSWDSQDFGDVNVVLKMAHFHKSSRPQLVNNYDAVMTWLPFSVRTLFESWTLNEIRRTSSEGRSNFLVLLLFFGGQLS